MLHLLTLRWSLLTMKTLTRIVIFLCFSSSALLAQLPTDTPVDALRHPAWNKGVWVAGSTSVASDPSAQSFSLGLRVGRVLTQERGKGFLRGTFEMAADIIPINEWWINGGQYAAAINPLVLKWNFTKGCRIAPFVEADGGVVLSTANLPPGDTSNVNFTSGATVGVQMFRRKRNSINLGVKVFHLSNASLGNHNPGINSSLQFMLGYTWH